MSSVKEAFNTAGTFTCTLASLADGSARGSTAVDNSSGLYLDAGVVVQVKTGASGVSSTGFITVYAYGSVDGGTTYTDGFGGTDGAATPSAMKLIGSFPAVANATTYVGQVMSVAAAFGGILPSHWGIVIENNSGAALDSTEGNHAKQYQELYSTVA